MTHAIIAPWDQRVKFRYQETDELTTRETYRIPPGPPSSKSAHVFLKSGSTVNSSSRSLTLILSLKSTRDVELALAVRVRGFLTLFAGLLPPSSSDDSPSRPVLARSVIVRVSNISETVVKSRGVLATHC